MESGKENRNNELVSIKKQSVRGQIFDQIRDKIVNGIWLPGTKIPSEKELTKMLGVSRLSIREALQKLVALDLLETHQGDGTYVKEIKDDLFSSASLPFLALSRPGVFEILQFRRALETGAIELSIANASEEDIAKLAENVEKMREAYNDNEKYSLGDFEFHKKLIELSGNIIMVNLYSVMANIIGESIINMQTTQGKKNASKYHGLIVEDFKNRDVEAGKKHIYEHLSIAIDRILNDEKIKQI